MHWHCDNHHDQAFNTIKSLLSSKKCLAYFDVKKQITIQTDASSFGIGATLLQDGNPIAYASRSMTSAQKNYAVIEKELLAVLFGCERFHHYIYGNKITVMSDHKPLENIMKECYYGY